MNDITPKHPKARETMNNDLISREALKEAVKNRFDNSEYFPFHFLALIDNATPVPQVTVFTETADETAVADLKAELQSVIEPRPQGKWINHRNDYGHNIADCSLCGKTMQWHDEDEDGIPRYCWYCGARLEEAEENA